MLLLALLRLFIQSPLVTTRSYQLALFCCSQTSRIWQYLNAAQDQHLVAATTGASHGAVNHSAVGLVEEHSYAVLRIAFVDRRIINL
jgi:hypothetical protein